MLTRGTNSPRCEAPARHPATMAGGCDRTGAETLGGRRQGGLGPGGPSVWGALVGGGLVARRLVARGLVRWGALPVGAAAGGLDVGGPYPGHCALRNWPKAKGAFGYGGPLSLGAETGFAGAGLRGLKGRGLTFDKRLRNYTPHPLVTVNLPAAATPLAPAPAVASAVPGCLGGPACRRVLGPRPGPPARAAPTRANSPGRRTGALAGPYGKAWWPGVAGPRVGGARHRRAGNGCSGAAGALGAAPVPGAQVRPHTQRARWAASARPHHRLALLADKTLVAPVDLGTRQAANMHLVGHDEVERAERRHDAGLVGPRRRARPHPRPAGPEPVQVPRRPVGPGPGRLLGAQGVASRYVIHVDVTSRSVARRGARWRTARPPCPHGATAPRRQHPQGRHRRRPRWPCRRRGAGRPGRAGQ